MLGKMDCHGLTDIGKVRKANEDQYLISDLNKSMQVHQTSLDLHAQTRLFGSSQGKLLLVADGMGGHAAGKRASTLAIDGIVGYVLNTMPWFFRLQGGRDEDFQDELKAALEHCQAMMRAEGERIPDRQGMGTTLTMAYLTWPRLYVVHVGDSRCYLLRGSRLKQITRDHTVAQQLVESGVLDDAEDSRWSHVLWNVVGGGSDELSPEVYKAELRLGDKLLLCTDGLSKHVPDTAITNLLGADAPAEEICHRLVRAANDAGGSDNITVVVAHFRDAQRHQEAGQAQAAAEESGRADAADAGPPELARAPVGAGAG
jgi:serine/threonine protein phosphatase PrpC